MLHQFWELCLQPPLLRMLFEFQFVLIFCIVSVKCFIYLIFTANSLTSSSQYSGNVISLLGKWIHNQSVII